MSPVFVKEDLVDKCHFDGYLINNLADWPPVSFELHKVLGDRDSNTWILYSSDLAQSSEVDRDCDVMTFWAQSKTSYDHMENVVYVYLQYV